MSRSMQARDGSTLEQEGGGKGLGWIWGLVQEGRLQLEAVISTLLGHGMLY